MQRNLNTDKIIVSRVVKFFQLENKTGTTEFSSRNVDTVEIGNGGIADKGNCSVDNVLLTNFFY